MANESRPERESEPHPLEWSDLEDELRARPPRYSSKAAWAELEKAMDRDAPPADVRPFRARPRPRVEPHASPPFASPNWAARIAAVLVLGGAITLAWRTTRPATETAAPAAMREVTTARGQRATVRLVDGTRVELGVGSRLRYAPEFGGKSRDVLLEGEAYFDVVHDRRRPFAVHTARAIVRDIGTKFGVRSYADAPEVEVVVAEGAVVLAPAARGARRDTVVLRPGDLGRLEADGRLATQRGIDVNPYLAWMDGRLVFVDTPLREVLPRIAHWYGVDIRLADSAVAERRYTASFKDETLPQMLDLMARALELRVERSANTVVLHGKSDVRPRSSLP